MVPRLTTNPKNTRCVLHTTLRYATLHYLPQHEASQDTDRWLVVVQGARLVLQQHVRTPRLCPIGADVSQATAGFSTKWPSGTTFRMANCCRALA